MPGRPKIVSMMTVPPRTWASWVPSSVTTGMTALRSPCLRTTTRSRSPFAHAVRT